MPVIEWRDFVFGLFSDMAIPFFALCIGAMVARWFEILFSRTGKGRFKGLAAVLGGSSTAYPVTYLGIEADYGFGAVGPWLLGLMCVLGAVAWFSLQSWPGQKADKVLQRGSATVHDARPDRDAGQGGSNPEATDYRCDCGTTFNEAHKLVRHKEEILGEAATAAQEVLDKTEAVGKELPDEVQGLLVRIASHR